MADEDLLVWAIVVLEDAAEQPGSLVLYERNSGGTYEPRSDGGATLYYEGDETDYWDPSDMDSCLVAYNRLDSDESGRIDWFRVRFNYTFPDGSSGYVDSDEFAVCQGTYLGGGESMLLGSGFTAIFPLDTDLVDPSKVSVTSATLTVGSEKVSLNGYVDTDEGVVRAGLLFSEFPAGVSLAYNGSSYTIEIETTYSDTGVSWEDAGECMLTTPNLGSYVLSATVDPLTVGDVIGPEGFVATFMLDEAVVGHPATYTNGESLSVKSLWLVQDSSGTEISAEYSYAPPAASPALIATYTAPSDAQLSGSYRVEVELSYNAPNADPPVVDLLDYGSASFTVGTNIFGDGNFQYESGTSLGGTINLRGGILPSDLSSFSFTVEKNGAWTDDFDPDGHETSGSDGWIGFRFPDNAIPTLDTSATYTVIAHATYGGAMYDSDPYPIEILVPAPNPFAGGSFTYEYHDGFNGTIRLITDVTPDELSNLSFTVCKNGTSVLTVDQSYVTNGTDSSGGWVGFDYAADDPPTLHGTAEDGYTVIATADYGGKSFSSEPIKVDITWDPYALSMYFDDETYAYLDGGIGVDGAVGFSFDSDSGYSYDVTLGSATIYVYDEIDTLIWSETVTPYYEQDGTLYYNFEATVSVPGDVEEQAYAVSITINATYVGRGGYTDPGESTAISGSPDEILPLY